MRGKLMGHYFASFIVACLTIFIVNISFMIMNIYNVSDNRLVFDYYPKDIIDDFNQYMFINDKGNVDVNVEGIKLLKENDIGLQILDENNNEVYQYEKPRLALDKYSNSQLIETYSNNENGRTLFLGEKLLEGNNYTYLLFFSNNEVKRVSFAYDVNLLINAHKFPLLILINLALVLGVSLFYTLKIANPIGNILQKILDLSQGDYSKKKISSRIYASVEKQLNDLGDRLNRNEEEREKLEKMREDWISNISHDIKTPLTSIIGNAEIMADTDYDIDTETRVKCCNTIISKSDYIKNLVEDLNLSTRLKNNILVLKKSKVNIVSLIRHVIIELVNDEKYSESNINFNYSNEEIFIDVDEQLISRVFVNLIINSFIHNNKDVKVQIAIDKIGDKVRVIIADNGKGVSEEDIKYIFKRYYRGTHTRNKTEGSGLGMAIAHDIIKSHNGDINIISRIGEGMKIEILL